MKGNTEGFKEKQKELQEREKQLLQEIKDDIFSKFINDKNSEEDQRANEKVATAHTNQRRHLKTSGSSNNTWTAKHFHRELDILSEVVDRDISSRNNMFSRNSNMAQTSHSMKFPKVKK